MSLSNLFHTPSTLFALLRNVKCQRKFIKEHLQAELNAAKDANDGSLEENDFKKITDYYGLAVPAILGETICTLRGSPMTQQERSALTYQGAMTGLFDDFFDKQHLPDETIRVFMERPKEAVPRNSGEKLFLDFYNQALHYAHDPALVKTYLRKVYQAQIDSRKQSGPGLTPDEILEITLRKGGVSVLFYRAALSHPFIAGEENALLQMGGLMQFGNDIFDVYKDRNHGIHTLMTTANKVNDVRTSFRRVMEESFTAVSRLGYDRRDIKRSLRLVTMCLCSRCFVFFDQMERKERTTGNVFRLHEYSREDLVCDMEKAGNKWKTVLYFVRGG